MKSLTSNTLPAIVPPLLAQIGKLRAAGRMTDELFSAQVDRLSRQELAPRGFTLVAKLLPGAHSFFEIRDRQGETVRTLRV